MPLSRSTFKDEIRSLDPTQFEHLIADLWEAQGWTTQVTQQSQDRGVDVFVSQDTPVRQRHAIQVKRYGESNPVGSPEIQQYSSIQHQEKDIDAAVVVTSSRFSEQAEEVARELNVRLIDGDELFNTVQSQGLSDVVEDYIQSAEGNTRAEPTRSQISSEHVGEPEKSGPTDSKWGRRIMYAVSMIGISQLLNFSLVGVGLAGVVSESIVIVASAVFSIVTFGGYGLIVVSIYYDTKYVSDHATWEPNTAIWVFGAVVFHFFVGIYYLYKRRSIA